MTGWPDTQEDDFPDWESSVQTEDEPFPWPTESEDRITSYPEGSTIVSPRYEEERHSGTYGRIVGLSADLQGSWESMAKLNVADRDAVGVEPRLQPGSQQLLPGGVNNPLHEQASIVGRSGRIVLRLFTYGIALLAVAFVVGPIAGQTPPWFDRLRNDLPPSGSAVVFVYTLAVIASLSVSFAIRDVANTLHKRRVRRWSGDLSVARKDLALRQSSEHRKHNDSLSDDPWHSA